MNFCVDWSQNSTKRGAIWLVGGLLGTIFAFAGKDPMQIMTITATVAGGLGVAIRD